MDLRNNIKILGAFKKFIDGLYAVITALRVIAVIILVLQAIFLITDTGKNFSDFKLK